MPEKQKTPTSNTGEKDGRNKYRKTGRPYQIPENKTAISNTGAEYNRKNKMKYCCNT
jgi:hypothetical protein